MGWSGLESEGAWGHFWRSTTALWHKVQSLWSSGLAFLTPGTRFHLSSLTFGTMEHMEGFAAPLAQGTSLACPDFPRLGLPAALGLVAGRTRSHLHRAQVCDPFKRGLVGSAAASAGAGGTRRTRNGPTCSWAAAPWGADGLEVAFPRESLACFFVFSLWWQDLALLLENNEDFYFLQAIKGSGPLSQARPPGTTDGIWLRGISSCWLLRWAPIYLPQADSKCVWAMKE